MKQVSQQFRDHTKQEVTTLCTIWKVIRTDGEIFGFTDCAEDIEYEGVTYSASSGHSPSAITTNSAMSVDNLDIVSVLDDSRITPRDISAGKWDFAEIQLMRINYEDLSMGVEIIRTGTLGRISVKRGSFNAELRGITQVLQQGMGSVYSPGCRATLGDSKCKFDIQMVTFPGTVETVTNNRTFTDTSQSSPDGYFNYGVLKWITGDNEGLKMEVKSFASYQIELQLPMPYEVKIGDTFEITAGCDKSRDMCFSRFNNVINFQGEPDVPGNDQILKVAG